MFIISDHGLLFTAGWEGEVLHEYRDIVKILTIGYGHVVLAGESFPGTITHEEALALLRKDMQKAIDAINKYCVNEDGTPIELTQNWVDALCSFVFNCGRGALEHKELGSGRIIRSTVLVKLKLGDYRGAADALLMWCKAGGKPNTGLLNRRKAERQLALTPDEKPKPSVNAPQPIQPPTEIVLEPEPAGSQPDHLTILPSNSLPSKVETNWFVNFINLLVSIFSKLNSR